MNSEVSEAFRLLGFSEEKGTPNISEVRKAFFESARRNHPDKNTKSDQNTKEEREEIFKVLLNAYKIAAESIFMQQDEEEDWESEDEDDFPDEISFREDEY